MRRVFVVSVLALGCTVDDSSNPFGATSATTYTTSVSTTVPSSDESGSSGSGETGEAESSSSSDAAESSTGAAESSTGAMAESSSDGGDTTGGNPMGTQPDEGMYSACTDPEECGVVPTLCITIQDAMMNPLAGFCSETGCMNNGTNCDASPGGTATPMCMPVTVNNMADQACALDCSGGKTCPPPMSCRALNGGLMVCA
ncbi:MAG TPA: hypothetical protein VG755_19060 [Nannocystaceae bacterium]|nr:hypothetical protein [Nannocystaceae bacterium]